MQQLLEEAKIYALSSSPVMIYGQAGIEDYLIAEAIHNNSDRRNGPYVSINMRGMDIEKQMEALFSREDADQEGANGGRGAMLKADRGTLFIKGIEHLTLRVQHQILRTMLSRAMMRTDAQPIDALDVRLIGSSKVNLQKLVKQGKFSEELKLVIYRSPESERLEKLLEKYHGNRNAVAAELGISTTTLWRRMKKYGIEPNYVN